MIYENINGWFNYESFYDAMIERFDNANFVEIGAWKGKSACYMGERLKDTGKNIRYTVVDNFKGSPTEKVHLQDKEIVNGTLYETFLKNIRPLRAFIGVIRDNSEDVPQHLSDSTIDFLFIDGDHTYEAVKRDIKLWLPKVKKGGVISGHDYDLESVKRAVDEIFPDRKIWDKSNVWYKEL